MSMNLSVVLVQGDQSSKLQELFVSFGYEFTGNIEKVRGGDPSLRRISFPRKEPGRDIVYKAAMVEGNWTAILDGEFVMIIRACLQNRIVLRWSAKR